MVDILAEQDQTLNGYENIFDSIHIFYFKHFSCLTILICEVLQNNKIYYGRKSTSILKRSKVMIFPVVKPYLANTVNNTYFENIQQIFQITNT